MATNSSFIELQHKHGAKIAYQFFDAPTPSKPTLIVFVNGLGLPKAGWIPAIEQLQKLRGQSVIPAMLTYDRYGQGETTDRDPTDAGAEDPSHGHDCMSATRDLHQLISQIASEKLSVSSVNDLQLILVSNSIGGALVRLYAKEYPNSVTGFLFLDSVLANSDFVSIYPDPDSKDFDASTLPDGITADMLRQERAGVMKVFHPSNGSREGLSRKNLIELLPHSDQPKIDGPDGSPAWITVVGHEFDAFAKEAAHMGRPEILTKTYVNPYWHKFNEGLATLTSPERSRGPLQAPGSGHFIQKSNPGFVADELNLLLNNIIGN